MTSHITQTLDVLGLDHVIRATPSKRPSWTLTLKAGNGQPLNVVVSADLETCTTKLFLHDWFWWLTFVSLGESFALGLGLV
jgi:hypothetical protein